MHRRDDPHDFADADGEDAWDDDWQDDGDETSAGWEGDDSADEPTVPCPYCRQDMLEAAPRCPACGNFISAEDQRGPGRPAWVIITAVICLGMTLWWLFAGG